MGVKFNWGRFGQGLGGGMMRYYDQQMRQEFAEKERRAREEAIAARQMAYLDETNPMVTDTAILGRLPGAQYPPSPMRTSAVNGQLGLMGRLAPKPVDTPEQMYDLEIPGGPTVPLPRDKFVQYYDDYYPQEKPGGDTPEMVTFTPPPGYGDPYPVEASKMGIELGRYDNMGWLRDEQGGWTPKPDKPSVLENWLVQDAERRAADEAKAREKEQRKLVDKLYDSLTTKHELLVGNEKNYGEYTPTAEGGYERPTGIQNGILRSMGFGGKEIKTAADIGTMVIGPALADGIDGVEWKAIKEYAKANMMPTDAVIEAWSKLNPNMFQVVDGKRSIMGEDGRWFAIDE